MKIFNFLWTSKKVLCFERSHPENPKNLPVTNLIVRTKVACVMNGRVQLFSVGYCKTV